MYDLCCAWNFWQILANFNFIDLCIFWDSKHSTLYTHVLYIHDIYFPLTFSHFCLDCLQVLDPYNSPLCYWGVKCFGGCSNERWHEWLLKWGGARAVDLCSSKVPHGNDWTCSENWCFSKKECSTQARLSRAEIAEGTCENYTRRYSRGSLYPPKGWLRQEVHGIA